LTIGSGTFTGNYSINLRTGALNVDANTHISVATLKFLGYGAAQTIPIIANGYDCSIWLGWATTLTQTGNVVLNSTNSITMATATNYAMTWKTDGYNLTVGGNIQIGAGSDTGLKKLDATHNGARTSTITVGGNWLNYGTGTAPSQFIADNSTVIFTGTGTITSGAQNSQFNNVEFNGSGKTFTIADELRCNSLTYTAGTIVNPGYVRPAPYPSDLTLPLIRKVA
jgi:hypothetical protein